MKKILITIAYAAAVITASSCAKKIETSPNEANNRFLEAWMQVNYPGIQAEGLGIYVLDSEDGTGAEVKKDGYAVVNYTKTDLEGNITEYTREETARQLGTYAETSYYGPNVWLTTDETIRAGVQNAVIGMKVGGKKSVVVPSWLMTYSAYDSAEKYFKEESEYTNTIYDIEIVDFTTDINQWQIDSIGRFFNNSEIMIADKPASEIFAGMSSADTTQVNGFYYKELTAPSDTSAFPSDTTIYINYTGRLLNGLVFDTSIENVAKDNGLYSSSKEYGPVLINWGETYSDITMGTENSSIISGFALTLWQMQSFEKGIGVFYSPLGYNYSGSGASIPGYAPLIFEIEVVEKP